MRDYEIKIAISYLAVAGGLIFNFQQSSDEERSRNLQKLLSVLLILWAGFVMAISLTEAWVKFKAPLLQRHIGLDVGRHVFRALNIIETVLMLSTWTIYFIQGGANIQLLLIASVFSVYETFFLTPKLTELAKFRIVDGLRDCESDAEQKLLRQFKIELAGRQMPSSKWHVMYVLLEVAKVLLLLWAGWLTL